LEGFINPETRQKMTFSKEGTLPEIKELFHPCQLERRFGGDVETPSNFWPPYVGKVFQPDNSKLPLDFMEDDEYKRVL